MPEPGPQPGDIQPVANETRDRIITGLVTVVPFVALGVAAWQVWGDALHWSDIFLFVGMYFFTGLGITVGFHRHLTHRAFKTYGWLHGLLAILGSAAIEGPVISWVADHRKHHAFPDQEGDPHSPHVGHGSGLPGLWHAHVGWLMETQGQADWKKYAADLYDDPKMRRIGKRFPLIALASLLIPTVAGFVLDGFTLDGALRGLIWGGFVRIFLVHHATWSVNSICHIFGRRRFDIEDKSTNVWWLAVFSLGENWHHNHHAFPRSAFHGLRWYELDLSGIVILAMSKVGLAWNVIRIPRERQQAKALVPAGR